MKRYLITSSDIYTQDEETFMQRLAKSITHFAPEYILYRDKQNLEYDKLASHFIQLCQSSQATKSFLHQDIELANKLEATGVHLTSLQLDSIVYAKSLGLEVIVSTHTKKEVLQAQSLGADAVTFSPIFASPNKGEPKGVKALEALLSEVDIPVFALGGIVSEREVQKIQATQVYGFASIRYFDVSKSRPAKAPLAKDH